MDEKPAYFWITLSVLCLTVFITVLDTTLLNVSLPTLVKEFNTPIRHVQWAMSVYSLVLVSLMITGGRLGDFWGRKRLFIVGAIIFALGSFIASISPTVWALIVGEGVEGIGAAIMVPATSALIVSSFKGRARATAFGLYTGFASLAAAAGPLFGGYFTTFYSWRDGFRINIFIVAILLAGSVFINDTRDTEEDPRLDFVGVILSSLAMFFIVFGIIEASAYGWWHAKETFFPLGYSLNSISVTPVSIALGLIILGVFIFWQARRVRTHKTPLISPRIFLNWQFSSGLIMTFLIYIGVIGISFVVSLSSQTNQDFSAFSAGLLLVPYGLTSFFASQFSAYMSRYVTPRRLMQIGLLCSLAGMILLRRGLASPIGPLSLLPALMMCGLGLGLTFAQFTNLTLSAVSAEETGEASGIFNTVRYSGALVGLALAGSLFVSVGIQTALFYNILLTCGAFLFSFSITKSKNLELNRSAR